MLAFEISDKRARFYADEGFGIQAADDRGDLEIVDLSARGRVCDSCRSRFDGADSTTELPRNPATFARARGVPCEKASIPLMLPHTTQGRVRIQARYLGLRIEILLFFGSVVLFTIEVYWEIEGKDMIIVRHLLDVARSGKRQAVRCLKY